MLTINKEASSMEIRHNLVAKIIPLFQFLEMQVLTNQLKKC